MIKMMSDILLVEEFPFEDKTNGGIFIPDNAKESTQQGIVVSVGPGRRTKKKNKIIPTEIKPGDRVIFDHRRSYPTILMGKNYLMVREEHLLGVIEKPCKTTNKPQT